MPGLNIFVQKLHTDRIVTEHGFKSKASAAGIVEIMAT
jgi:hypothetical protein